MARVECEELIGEVEFARSALDGQLMGPEPYFLAEIALIAQTPFFCPAVDRARF